MARAALAHTERPDATVKRFWKDVAAVAGPDGWSVRLDGRPVRTPGRALLSVPSQPLADAIAAEWRDCGEDIDPRAMPLTGLANAAIDLVQPDSARFAEPLTAYGNSDLLCYRDDRDAALFAQQAALWDPLLDTFAARHGVTFSRTQGIVPVDQPPSTLAALDTAVRALDAFRLAALSPLVSIGGSLVAALAVIADPVASDVIWNAVTLDETYQENRWGFDAEASALRDARKVEWDNAVRFVTLL